MAYVDFKMAQLQEGAFATQSNDPSRHATLQALLVGDGPRERRPASLGKLMEIDLGPDATLRNIARTEAATRRINTGEAEELENDPVGRKMRLGRDGKPFRPRRYRRNSNDVKRDKLVEEVMKESRRRCFILRS